MNRAYVKQVISGDTVLLITGPPQNGPPPERQISFSSIVAPRFSRAKDGKNEPFGFDSREFLRKKLAGKQVMYRVDYSAGQTARDYGTIMLGEENVACSVVAEGCAKVRAPTGNQTGSPDLAQLQELERQAQAANKGVWSKEEQSGKDAVWTVDLARLHEQLRTRPQPAIVEQVRDAASLRVLLLPGLQMVNVNLAGLQCDTYRRAKDSDDVTTEPFANEGRFVAENLVLGKDVTLQLEGPPSERGQSLYATVLVGDKNLSLELLKLGLAKVVSWGNPSNVGALRQAEKVAKDGRLRMWRSYVPADTGFSREFFGRVVEVVTGDTIIVQEESGKQQEVKVTLSSIRAPRFARRGNAAQSQAGAAKPKDDPWAFEAKEFLRQELIGCRVRVGLEYKRVFDAPSSDNKPNKIELICGSVFNGDKNVAEALVHQGFVEVSKHRADEDRSLFYDDLLSAEAQAKDAKRGRYSGKDAPQHNIQDLTTDQVGAKKFFPSLQRQRTLTGIVEHVFNASRVKLTIPSEHCSVGFTLAGIRCPAMPSRARSDGGQAAQGEPFGEEAALFTREKALQRRVEVTVLRQDKFGLIHGTMTVAGKDLATQLLDAGFAYINTIPSDTIPKLGEMQAAQKAAREANRKCWAAWNEEEAQAARESNEGAPMQDMRVCEVVNGNLLFVHFPDEQEALNRIDARVKQLTQTLGNRPGGENVELKAGATVLARYSDDNQLYRARIESVNSSKGQVRVLFLDHGNTETVAPTAIYFIEEELASIPPQAHECSLAFVRTPELSDVCGEQAAIRLSDLVMNKTLRGRVEHRDQDGRSFITLVAQDAESGRSINEQMVWEGLARVKPMNDKRFRATLNRYKDIESEAKSHDIGVWQYTDEDEEVALSKRGAGGAGGRANGGAPARRGKQAA